jgi:hypothetical protein
MIWMERKLSDQVRDAIKGSKLSRYAICKTVGLNQGTMSRFMSGGGLSLDTLDKLAEVLDLSIVVGTKQRRK